MTEGVLQEVLNSLQELNGRVTTLAEQQARAEERYVVFAENFKQRTQNIQELMGMMNQGKTAAKLVAGFIAVLAGLGAAWDWIVAHIRIL